MNNQPIYLIYDGQCPLCNSAAKALKIRKSAGSLQLINARENHPIMQEIYQAKLDIDKCMVVKLNGKLYHGADAQHVLALIGTNNDFINRLNVCLFRSKYISTALYPILRMMRNILLHIKGIPPVNNLNHDN